WYLSLIQRARDGTKRDEALCLECTNCRSQSLGLGMCGLLACQSIVDPALGAQAQARQHPLDGGAMPATATRGRYTSSVQLNRKRSLGSEAIRDELPNGRGHSKSAGVCGLFVL